MTTRPITPKTILLFWLPLAATWFMMALEGPYIAAVVARMPEAARSLAAFGVATSLAWLIESPIMMLLSAAVALARDRSSFLALRRFATILNVAVTICMALLALPPIFHFIGETVIGLPRDISELAQESTAILILWPASIGYRRFYQGMLVRNHLTSRVALGTVVRLSSMTLTGAALAIHGRMPGATIGAFALIAGVICEALVSRWMARHVVRRVMASEEIASGTLLRFGEIARFYYPLAMTSVLSMALGPLVTFGLGRSRAPIESLAVWPVITALIFLFRSGGVAFQEVAIALAGPRSEHAREVARTAMWIGTFATLSLAVVAFTPLESVWLERVSGLTHDLALFAAWPIRILVILPVTEYILSIQRAEWIVARRTAIITIATAIEVGMVAAGMVVTIGALGMVGAVGGTFAMIFGRLAANGYFAIKSPARTSDAAIEARRSVS